MDYYQLVVSLGDLKIYSDETRTKHTQQRVCQYKQQTQTTMKRYTCEMNDGEFLQSFHQLKDARNYRAKNNFNYISRYIRIYDNKKNCYIN